MDVANSRVCSLSPGIFPDTVLKTSLKLHNLRRSFKKSEKSKTHTWFCTQLVSDFHKFAVIYEERSMQNLFGLKLL